MSQESQKIGEFLEWLQSRGFTVCETYNDPDSLRDGEYLPMRKSVTDLLALYFEIDMTKVEDERRALLEEQRALNKKERG